ncbi:MAG: transcriptional regulator, partial [Nannocystis sp.]
DADDADDASIRPADHERPIKSNSHDDDADDTDDTDTDDADDFNPQPDPPGFNPQPDPPGADDGAPSE